MHHLVEAVIDGGARADDGDRLFDEDVDLFEVLDDQYGGGGGGLGVLDALRYAVDALLDLAELHHGSVFPAHYLPHHLKLQLLHFGLDLLKAGVGLHVAGVQLDAALGFVELPQQAAEHLEAASTSAAGVHGGGGG